MNQSIVFFDGVCNLCTGSVQFILRHDKHKRFMFSSLQSEFAAKELSGHDLTDLKSIILKEGDNIYTKSTAALRIASKLSFPVNILYGLMIFPRFIRDFVYNIISRNRYKWFGKKEVCWLPNPELKARFIN